MIPLSTTNRIIDSELQTDPFNHIVIDDFLEDHIADQLEKEFPAFNSKLWYVYDNPIEVKKTMNFWDRFPPTTYQLFWDFCDPYFTEILSDKFAKTYLYPDIGLNGGGWHIHGSGGKLNVHLDYSIHPKINMQRKVNIILYLSRNWQPNWGGTLELWSNDEETNKPKERIKNIDIKFNRAVIFDTTQNSWHGFNGSITCPPDHYRKSIAMYYVQYPDNTATDCHKATYSPSKQQENDPEVLAFIEKRKNINWRNTNE